MTEIDREKAIKGLEICSHIGWCVGDNDCPYWRNDLEGKEQFDLCKSMLSDVLTLMKEQKVQIKTRDESLEKAREEIKWLRGMLKEQETTLNRLRSMMEAMVRGNASEEVSYLLRLLDKWE